MRNQKSQTLFQESLAESSIAQAQALEIKLAVSTLRTEEEQARSMANFAQSESAAVQRDEAAQVEKGGKLVELPR